jgi:hypothetical protein
VGAYELRLLDQDGGATAIVADDREDAERQARKLIAGWYRGRWELREASNQADQLERRNAERRPAARPDRVWLVGVYDNDKPPIEVAAPTAREARSKARRSGHLPDGPIWAKEKPKPKRTRAEVAEAAALRSPNRKPRVPRSGRRRA